MIEHYWLAMVEVSCNGQVVGRENAVIRTPKQKFRQRDINATCNHGIRTVAQGAGLPEERLLGHITCVSYLGKMSAEEFNEGMVPVPQAPQPPEVIPAPAEGEA